MHERPNFTRTEPPLDTFARRHIGPDAAEKAAMLKALDLESMEALIERTVPAQIRLQNPLNLPVPAGEQEALEELRALASRNQVFKSYIGQGYSACITPPRHPAEHS